MSAARALGIDVEIDEPLSQKLETRVLRPSEQAWIATRPEADRGFWGMLVFSAKESVYKAQHPLSRQFLEFGDVEIAEPARGTFSATLLKRASPFPVGRVFEGRFVRSAGVIATAVTITD